MALINENIKQNLSNNLVANYDVDGNGAGVNGQPLQVSSYGNLKTTDRIEYNVVNGGTWSGQYLNVIHDEIGSTLEILKSDLAVVMNSSGLQYAYNFETFVCLDNSTPNRYNVYASCWLSNY